ncbi:MAG: hypothetical protein IJQ80_03550 [Clostridia bacterium]|nr:hypothetical protein [Clostridia bacterium]
MTEKDRIISSDAGRPRSLGRAAVWFFMLAKRLLLRKSFVALLLAIPLLGGSMALVAGEESGIVTVLLVAEGGEGTPQEIVRSLLDEEKTAIKFIRYESEERAIDEVKYGRADALWIFPDDIDERIDRYLSGDSSSKLAEAYIRSDTALQKLIGERLSEALFPFVSMRLSSRYAEELSAERGYDFDEERLREYYRESEFKGDIVALEYLSSVTSVPAGRSYLTSPVRGMAYLASFLCTLAATLYSMEDERRGFLSRLPGDRRFLVIFASNLAASLISSAVALASCALCGASVSAASEITSALLFALSSCALCTLLGRVFSTTYALGAAAPPLILVMSVVCPVFISFNVPAHLDLLFPLTFAVRAIRLPKYIGFSLIYTAVVTALSYGADRLRRRKR